MIFSEKDVLVPLYRLIGQKLDVRLDFMKTQGQLCSDSKDLLWVNLEQVNIGFKQL